MITQFLSVFLLQSKCTLKCFAARQKPDAGKQRPSALPYQHLDNGHFVRSPLNAIQKKETATHMLRLRPHEMHEIEHDGPNGFVSHTNVMCSFCTILLSPGQTSFFAEAHQNVKTSPRVLSVLRRRVYVGEICAKKQFNEMKRMKYVKNGTAACGMPVDTQYTHTRHITHWCRKSLPKWMMRSHWIKMWPNRNGTTKHTHHTIRGVI